MKWSFTIILNWFDSVALIINQGADIYDDKTFHMSKK